MTNSRKLLVLLALSLALVAGLVRAAQPSHVAPVADQTQVQPDNDQEVNDATEAGQAGDPVDSTGPDTDNVQDGNGGDGDGETADDGAATQ